MATVRGELELLLDKAAVSLEDSDLPEFEKALAEQGIDFLDQRGEEILEFGQKAFSHALILIAAGKPAEARAAVYNLSSFEERLSARRKALRLSEEETQLEQDVFDFLADVALTALKAALPFVLAAIL